MKRASRTVVGLAMLLLFLFPVYWMISTSFKSGSEILTYPPHWVPSSPTLDSYRDRVLHNISFLRYVRNSAIVAVGTTVLSLALAAPAAYALARFRFRGRLLVLLLSMTTLFFPGVMLALPLFVIFSKLGLINSYLGLIIANSALSVPFSVVVLRPAFLSVPPELTEAARIDGCSPWSAFIRIVLPLARPGLATAGIFAFLAGWNDLVFALSFATRDSYQPVTAGIWSYISNTRTDWSTAMAYSTLAMLPTLIVFVFAQRFIVSGLTSGSVK
jgi:multiple sugar transport system permease protein